jgi:hypothetical protein
VIARDPDALSSAEAVGLDDEIAQVPQVGEQSILAIEHPVVRVSWYIELAKQ